MESHHNSLIAAASMLTSVGSLMFYLRLRINSLKSKYRTGIVYDEIFLRHSIPKHVENPGRVKSIMDLIIKENIIEKCVYIPSREATEDEIKLAHDASVIENIQKTKTFTDSVHLGNDIFANKYTSRCASVAAGSLINLAVAVMNGSLDNGFAIIRPPGHHAGIHQSSGFCVYNNVAIAARTIQQMFGKDKKILIIDWDVHHGNGTEEIFYEDNSVVYFSVHKYGNTFYPGTGYEHDCGKGKGEGFNVNAPFYGKGMGDGDYIQMFKHLLVPIANQFNPDLVIVSAGFDCGLNDKLGPMDVSTAGFSQMMHAVKDLAGGKVICALEGGYTYETTSAGVLACINVMLGEDPLPCENYVASINGWKDITKAVNIQQKHWSVLDKIDREDTSKNFMTI
jgi:histone deacetylase 6